MNNFDEIFSDEEFQKELKEIEDVHAASVWVKKVSESKNGSGKNLMLVLLKELARSKPQAILSLRRSLLDLLDELSGEKNE